MSLSMYSHICFEIGALFTNATNTKWGPTCLWPVAIGTGHRRLMSWWFDY